MLTTGHRMRRLRLKKSPGPPGNTAFGNAYGSAAIPHRYPLPSATKDLSSERARRSRGANVGVRNQIATGSDKAPNPVAQKSAALTILRDNRASFDQDATS